MSDCHECGGGNCTVAALPGAPARRTEATTTAHVIAVVGPPNSGKSTLFNRLTGLRQKVANFPGVTVEHRVGRAKMTAGQPEVVLIDLPGVYSLHARSEDEQVTSDVLKGARKDIARPDAVLLILDCTNLGRHLLLAAPVLSLKLPTLVILNMADDLHGRGGEVDPAALSRQLGAPVALISAFTGEGVEKVFQFMAGTAVGHTHAKAPLMELPVLQDVPRCRRWASEVGNGAGYRAPAPPLWTRRLDAVFLHPLAGPLVFLAVVVAVFQTIFSGARPIMDALLAFIQTSGQWMTSHLPASILTSLFVEGIWTGVGSVIVFLPQILILFLFIGVLEDSGYLARAALIADRTMRKFGLQGKSFIPLLSAYACAVPAIMATRTIENKRDRIATIMIAPFMTCSARLPVYTLIIAAFFQDRPLLGPFLGVQAAAMLGLYVLGFVAAIGTARLLKSSILKSERTPFLLEMPPYRWPTARGLALRLYDRPFCGTGDQAAGFQLEDRDRADYVARGARSDCGHAGDHLWNGRHGANRGPAEGSAERIDAGRSGGAVDIFCVRDAVHVDHCGGAPGDRRMEVACHPVRLYDAAGVCGRAGHEFVGDAVRWEFPATELSISFDVEIFIV